MSQDSEFFRWIVDNNDWRVDYVHKVGKDTVGFQVSHKNNAAQKHVMFDVNEVRDLCALLDVAKVEAKPSEADKEPMATMSVSVPARLVPEFTALFNRLLTGS
jgi:hypothetical protein